MPRSRRACEVTDSSKVTAHAENKKATKQGCDGGFTIPYRCATCDVLRRTVSAAHLAHNQPIHYRGSWRWLVVRDPRLGSRQIAKYEDEKFSTSFWVGLSQSSNSPPLETGARGRRETPSTPFLLHLRSFTASMDDLSRIAAVRHILPFQISLFSSHLHCS